MSESRFQVAAVGNALVDVLSHASEDFIEEQNKKFGMEKGSMMLIDMARAEQLYASMGPGIESSGGSAANTIAGLASFGGTGAYIGKVADDQLGKVFQHDLKALGIDYRTPPLNSGHRTGRCLVIVTPDAQRTMNTYLGACTELGPEDIDSDLISSAEVTYLEGYLFDKDPAKQAFIKAAELSHAAGHKVALTLSDSFCVDRHRHDFISLVEGHIDLLFANEDEIKSLFLQHEFSLALEAVRDNCSTAVITRGEKGALVVSGNDVIEIAPEPACEVVDTTGAGDQFAAGFLYGFTKEMPLDKCGELGAVAAAEVISHMGPRPEKKLKDLL